MQNYKSLIAPAAIAVVLMGVVTYVEGTWSERWAKADSPVLKEWCAKMQKLPMTIGEWEGKQLAQNQEELDYAGIAGSVSREYRNRNTGQVVSMFLVAGGARKVAVHTPDKCMVAAGYKMSKEPDPFNVVKESQFYTTTFSKEDVSKTDYLRVFWGWNAGKGWQAPSAPRWEFRGKEALFKMYLMTPLVSQQDEITLDPTLEFMKVAEPELHRILFPEAKRPVPAPAKSEKTG